MVGHEAWVAGGDFVRRHRGHHGPGRPRRSSSSSIGPNGAFLSTLLNFRNYILPSKQILAAAPNIHTLDNTDTWALPYWQAPTSRSGPYKWLKTEVDQFIEFDANPSYWQGAPPFEKVQLFQIQDFAVAAAQLPVG